MMDFLGLALIFYHPQLTMPWLSVADLKVRMERLRNLRYVCILGQTDISKLIHALLPTHGLVIHPQKPLIECGCNEPTADSNLHHVIYKLDSNQLDSLKNDNQFEVENGERVNEFVIGMLKAPECMERAFEIGASIRLSDGALIVVDCAKGITDQTTQLIKMAADEHLHFLLFIDGLSRALNNEKTAFSDLYKQCFQIVERINLLFDELECVWQERLSPLNGTVLFGSSDEGWAFDLERFGGMYTEKFGLELPEITSKLWGNHYFSPKTKKWSTNENEGEHAFCKLVLEPITKLNDAVLNLSEEEIGPFVEARLRLQLSDRCFRSSSEQSVFQKIIEKWLPISASLLPKLCLHLPSVFKAQSTKIACTYPYRGHTKESIIGPGADDEMLMIQVASLLGRNEWAMGRIMSGRVSKRQLVGVVNAGKKKVNWKKIKNVAFIHSRYIDYIESASAGSIVLLDGLDQFVNADCTIVNKEEIHSFRTIDYPKLDQIKVSVEMESKKDMEMLAETLKKYTKIDPSFKYDYSKELNKHFVTTNGGKHLEHFMGQLEDRYYLRGEFKDKIKIERIEEERK